jgi:hypothetical protein
MRACPSPRALVSCRNAVAVCAAVLLAPTVVQAEPATTDAPAAAGPRAPVNGDTAPVSDLPAAANGSVFVDPAGFLLFGPTVGVEVALGQYSVIAYGRWLNGGLLAKSLFESDDDRFSFSYGGGVEGRYYFGPRLLGPHLGAAVEALKTRTVNHTDKIATSNVIIVPEVEAGYRAGFGRFYLDAAIDLGYAIQSSKSVANIDGGNQAASFEPKDYSTVYGSANLDLGLLF